MSLTTGDEGGTARPPEGPAAGRGLAGWVFRTVHGPSILDPATVTVLECPPWNSADRIDPAWERRWLALWNSVGVGKELPERAVSPGQWTASAVEMLVAHVRQRPAVAVRPGLTEREFVLPETELELANAALPIVLATARWTRLGDPPAANVERLRQGVAGIRDVAAECAVESDNSSVAVMIEAAARLGLPWRWSRSYPRMLVLGEGRRRTLFDGSAALSTPIGSVLQAGVKIAGKRYLRSFGLPVLPERVVTRAEDVAAAAEAVGYPIVVKPIDGSRGRGLSLDVRSRAEAEAAFREAAPGSRGVMIEPYLAVPDYRAILVGQRLHLAYCRMAPELIGDGHSSISDLLSAYNANLQTRGPDILARHEVPVDRDLTMTLERAGLQLGSVPASGQPVRLRTIPLGNYGGVYREVTGRVHPATVDLFRRIMSLTGLAIAAIDFRAEAIERSWRDQRFAILEYNAKPDLARYGGHPLVDDLLRRFAPDAESVRIPTYVVVDPDPGPAVRCLRERIVERGLPLAVVTDHELEIGGITIRVPSGAAHGRLAEDPTIDGAIHWVTPAALGASGLGVPVIDEAWVGSRTDSVTNLVRRHARAIRALPTGEPAVRSATVLEAVERFLSARRTPPDRAVCAEAV